MNDARPQIETNERPNFDREFPVQEIMMDCGCLRHKPSPSLSDLKFAANLTKMKEFRRWLRTIEDSEVVEAPSFSSQPADSLQDFKFQIKNFPGARKMGKMGNYGEQGHLIIASNFSVHFRRQPGRVSEMLTTSEFLISSSCFVFFRIFRGQVERGILPSWASFSKGRKIQFWNSHILNAGDRLHESRCHLHFASVGIFFHGAENSWLKIERERDVFLFLKTKLRTFDFPGRETGPGPEFGRCHTDN